MKFLGNFSSLLLLSDDWEMGSVKNFFEISERWMTPLLGTWTCVFLGESRACENIWKMWALNLCGHMGAMIFFLKILKSFVSFFQRARFEQDFSWAGFGRRIELAIAELFPAVADQSTAKSMAMTMAATQPHQNGAVHQNGVLASNGVCYIL